MCLKQNVALLHSSNKKNAAGGYPEGQSPLANN
jgi:hypothetical protein